ncbi:hypothetical protein O181_001487 [Austropuccinia psidii MF-1]|uniref:Amino acid permease/ SLC12A domain-containing protein n=1 Tax=Austropuccinia psidii MF-1 TaxID=1389203 RepID=A0A9Q3GD33_9BASI|nr:hypothetical protein [Austropuccinia psidii MF-1]
MVTQMPCSGALTTFSTHFVDPALGFAGEMDAVVPSDTIVKLIGISLVLFQLDGVIGTYVLHFTTLELVEHNAICYFLLLVNTRYSLVTAMASELIAAAIVVDYWKTPLSKAIWIIFSDSILLELLGTNALELLPSKSFPQSRGDCYSPDHWYCFGLWYIKRVCREDFFAKPLIMNHLFRLKEEGRLMNLLESSKKNGFQLDDKTSSDFSFVQMIRYLKEPGLFRHTNGIPGVLGKLISLWSVLVQTSYSFLGSESVALAAAEAQNPRTTIPNATKSLTYRALMVGLLVPSDEPRLLGGTGDASSSPFVIAINRAKIKLFPDLINAFVLLSAYSAASATLYGASRIIYGLVKDNMAPKFVGKVTSGGVPIIATIISVLPGFLAYMNLSQKASELFSRLVNISSMTGLFTWWTICLAYIRYHKALKLHKISRDNFAYKAPFQPYLSYYGLVCLTFIMLTNGVTVFGSTSWSWRDFAGAYITCPFFFGTYFFW